MDSEYLRVIIRCPHFCVQATNFLVSIGPKARWIRCDNYLPGIYAISVTGQFDRDMEEELESRGARWRCRPVGSDPTSGMP